MNPESYLCLGILVSGGLGFGGLRLWIARQNRLAENLARDIYESLDKPRQTVLPDPQEDGARIIISPEIEALATDYDHSCFQRLARKSNNPSRANIGVLALGRMIKEKHFK